MFLLQILNTHLFHHGFSTIGSVQFCACGGGQSSMGMVSVSMWGWKTNHSRNMLTNSMMLACPQMFQKAPFIPQRNTSFPNYSARNWSTANFNPFFRQTHMPNLRQIATKRYIIQKVHFWQRDDIPIVYSESNRPGWKLPPRKISVLKCSINEWCLVDDKA